jgi:hypothetical protein
VKTREIALASRLPRIIGFAGPARVGKDTIAAEFVGYKRRAFADDLKRRVADALGISADELEHRKQELRPLLVAMGRAARSIDPMFWVRPVQWALTGFGNFVVPDVRYENESRMIHRHGGVVVYVERSGVEFANDEEAATLPTVRAEADLIVQNDATPAWAAQYIIRELTK